MACVQPMSAFTAFENQLKTLCLNEFPCGIGSWRENQGQKKKSSLRNDRVITKYSVTLKDYGAGHEKTETLEEMVKAKKSPWNMDYSWSNEARKLREIAVQSPWLINETFVLSHFKTLRIADKNVEEIDNEFLKFVNLEELCLSANRLKAVNSRNLPPHLKVLEVCANEISQLSELCVRPPPLLHLGMGYNCLMRVDDYITGEYWPWLLSLDLSHNSLYDLMDLVKKLQTLPKLRNLLLQGNPLALIPGYRGFTIDSLRQLEYLDDINITADEKHHYKGLAKRKEYVLDEAKLQFHVSHIKGVPMPEEMKHPEEQPEFPIVTRKYCVQFHFLEDRSAKAEIFQILHDDNFDESTTQHTETSHTDHRSGNSGAVELHAQSFEPESGATPDKNVTFPKVMESVLDIPAGSGSGPSSAVGPSSTQPSVSSELEIPDEATVNEDGQALPSIKLAPINSASSIWMEEMPINWTRTLVRDDLRALRDFLKDGMEISVIEEKVLSYPADQLEDSEPEVAGKDGKKDKKDKKEDKTKDKDKGTKGDKPDKGVEEKKKKKKGEPDCEMVNMPPEITSLATFHIPLEDFLDGDFEFENVFVHVFSEENSSDTPESDVGISKKQEGKKDKDKKKPGSAKKKDAGKSPKDDKKDVKGKRKNSAMPTMQTTANTEEEEEQPPPPPLEVKVNIKLLQWKTALDLLKNEEEEREASNSPQIQS